MAVDTVNEKLALMEDMPWEPGLPIDPSTFGTDDKQQLLWEYPYGDAAPGGGSERPKGRGHGYGLKFGF